MSPVTSIAFEGPAAFNEAELLDLTAARPDVPWRNVLAVFEVSGVVVAEALALAVAWSAERHETTRTSFVRPRGVWRRVVHEPPCLRLEVVDASAEGEPEAVARAWVVGITAAPFDLASPPLARVAWIKLAPARSWFVLLADHAVIDGVGAASWLAEVIAAYGELAQARSPTASSVRQPSEHAARLETILAPLRDGPAPPRAPATAMNDEALPNGARAGFFLCEPCLLTDMAMDRRVSPAAPLVAAMALALREAARGDPAAFTLVRSGRSLRSLRTPGYLAWGDSLVVPMTGEDTLGSVLARADALVADTSPRRMLARDPRSQGAILNINRFTLDLPFPGGGLSAVLRADIFPEVFMWPGNDLFVQVFSMPDAVRGVARYRTTRLDDAAVSRFVGAMTRSLEALRSRPDARVRSLGELRR